MSLEKTTCGHLLKCHSAEGAKDKSKPADEEDENRERDGH